MTRYMALSVASLMFVACSSSPSSESPKTANTELTYYADAKVVIDAKCGGCHQPGQVGPFPLTTYKEVQTLAGAVRASIERGSMPPWQPSDDCNTYKGNFDLTKDEKKMLLTWLDAGAPAGDPADEPTVKPEPNQAILKTDISLELPEAYAPQKEPDDYRCQLIDWPAKETRYVTGLAVTPDKQEIVHHVIVFVVSPDQVERFRAFDEAEEGPGYTCYGGPTASESQGMNVDLATLLKVLDELGLTIGDVQSGNITPEQRNELASRLGVGGGYSMLGSWVPGVSNVPFPEGTGIRVEPGSMLVVQMHYNTLMSDSVPDKSMIKLATTDAVEREATIMLGLDLGWVTNGRLGDPMTIPAGSADVQHSTLIEFESVLTDRARQELGLEPGSPLVIHRAGHHMHELGSSQRSEIRHADGKSSCLLDIPDWDFSWQGNYTFESAVELGPGDKLWMGCAWDNSPENQPIISGKMRTPTDVSWGEGTTDEMCLGAFYVTAK